MDECYGGEYFEMRGVFLQLNSLGNSHTHTTHFFYSKRTELKRTAESLLQLNLSAYKIDVNEVKTEMTVDIA